MSRPKSILGFPGRKDRKSSSGSIPKVEPGETKEEKARYKINTKADPSKAINEAQPSAMPGETTIQPLRSLEHRDAEGSIITDPDLSNPTRPRLERPLDTIRSFEAAIDGSYNRRQSLRFETPNVINSQTHRRSGFYNGFQHPQRHTYDGSGSGGFYGGRNNPTHSRPESYMDGHANGPIQGGNAGRRFGPRNASDPALYGNDGNANIYSSPIQQPSHDTVGTGSNGSHVTEPWGNSTDPSSENSSVDRFPPIASKPQQPDLSETYGFTGFGGGPQFQGPILEEHGHDMPGYGQPGYGQSQSINVGGTPYQGNAPHLGVASQIAPRPPPKESGPTVPIKVGLAEPSQSTHNAHASFTTEKNEKRRSWFNRRFSRA